MFLALSPKGLASSTIGTAIASAGVAFFSGSGPNARAYKRGASLRFEKGVGAKYLELKINDRQRKLEPEFEIKDWE